MLTIGPYALSAPVMLAPMAGVTDLPFRQLCLRYGVGSVTAEMISSNPALRQSTKSRIRLEFAETGLRVAQIVGNIPQHMADAAQHAMVQGAQIIDINLGCPAKKVCTGQAGSALMRDEGLVAELLAAVCAAVEVPVTLKMRTGWSRAQQNGVAIARLAERAGVALLTVHGRTREDLYRGQAEYDTLARIRQVFSRTLIANGDIDSAAKARAVLQYTGANGVMIGRAALGRPWLPGQIAAALCNKPIPHAPTGSALAALVAEHTRALHRHYGVPRGVRIARKHLGWYLENQAWLNDVRPVRQRLFAIEQPEAQVNAVKEVFLTATEAVFAA